MGEVWQARDTKLDRDVALKVLPEAFTSDPDRLARFEREAKVLALEEFSGGERLEPFGSSVDYEPMTEVPCKKINTLEVPAMSRAVLSFSILLSLFSVNAFAAQTCSPDGEVQFVCGTTNPEDLYQIPETSWVIASGRVSDVAGSIYAVNIRDHSVREIFPQGASSPEHDTVTYRDCPGSNTIFQPHGLTLREGSDGIHILYVVGHGAREAIEIFNLDVRGNVPLLKWIGCIIAPEGTRRINSIAALPNGALGATNFDTEGGELWEWHPFTGWTEVPGSQMPGPNGLVSSADGQWFYIGGWSDEALVRLSRGQTPIQIDSVPVGFNVDNVRWGNDGNIVVAGHVTRCDESSDCELAVARVAKVNPNTLQVQQLVDYKGNEFFRLGTVAIEVDDEIWVGGIRGTLGIARFPQFADRVEPSPTLEPDAGAGDRFGVE